MKEAITWQKQKQKPDCSLYLSGHSSQNKLGSLDITVKFLNVTINKKNPKPNSPLLIIICKGYIPTDTQTWKP